MKPQRIRLSRRRGWKMPPNTVKVARPGKWGNPYKIGLDGSRDDIVYRFEQMLLLRLQDADFRQELDQLRGKNLACWCKLTQPCHADILLLYANKWGGSDNPVTQICRQCLFPFEHDHSRSGSCDEGIDFKLPAYLLRDQS